MSLSRTDPRQRSLRQERCPSLRALPPSLRAHRGEATDPRAPEDMVAADEGTGTLRAADLGAVVVLREAPEVDPDLEAEEVLVAQVAPVALADLEVQVAVAPAVGLGATTALAEDEVKEDSLHLAVGRHPRAVTRAEEVEDQPASGQKGRIGVGPPTPRCWKS